MKKAREADDLCSNTLGASFSLVISTLAHRVFIPPATYIFIGWSIVCPEAPIWKHIFSLIVLKM